MRWLYAIMMLVSVVGCGGKSDAAKTVASSPLTVAEWKALPVEEKYQSETIERLKKADPNLETPEGWDAFNRATLQPERRKDFPNAIKKR